MTPESSPGLLSVERAVAFIVGPAVTAVSGWFSLFVAKKWGIHVSGPELAGIFGTGGLSAAALAYKWLHGRQIEMGVEGMLAKTEQVPGVGEFMHVTLADLEGLAQKAANETVERFGGPPGGRGIAPGAVAAD